MHFKDENEPSKIRVLPAESEVPGSYAFRVMWSSLYGIEEGPKLQWWVPSCAVPVISTVDATSSTYTADDLCDEPATTWGYVREMKNVWASLLFNVEIYIWPRFCLQAVQFCVWSLAQISEHWDDK